MTLAEVPIRAMVSRAPLRSGWAKLDRSVAASIYCGLRGCRERAAQHATALPGERRLEPATRILTLDQIDVVLGEVGRRGEL